MVWSINAAMPGSIFVSLSLAEMRVAPTAMISLVFREQVFAQRCTHPGQTWSGRLRPSPFLGAAAGAASGRPTRARISSPICAMENPELSILHARTGGDVEVGLLLESYRNYLRLLARI